MEIIIIVYAVSMTALLTIMALCATLVIWTFIKKEGN